MAKSMTGFARVEVETPEGKFTGEARSLNSRYLEVVLKLPRSAFGYEQRLRDMVKKSVRRGRLDITVKWEKGDEGGTIPKINEEAVKWYVDLADHLKNTYGLQGNLTIESMMNFKDIFIYEEKAIPEEELFSAFQDLIAKLNEERAREGELIKQDLLGHLNVIRTAVDEIEERWPQAISKHEEVLREKIKEVIGTAQLDEVRVLQELAIYMERLDIAEEIVRLKGHLDHFRDTLDKTEEIGRKLDFIIQELVRETNTIGSKSNDLFINERVILVKVQTEKMREQVQNVE